MGKDKMLNNPAKECEMVADPSDLHLMVSRRLSICNPAKSTSVDFRGTREKCSPEKSHGNSLRPYHPPFGSTLLRNSVVIHSSLLSAWAFSAPRLVVITLVTLGQKDMSAHLNVTGIPPSHRVEM